ERHLVPRGSRVFSRRSPPAFRRRTAFHGTCGHAVFHDRQYAVPPSAELVATPVFTRNRAIRGNRERRYAELPRDASFRAVPRNGELEPQRELHVFPLHR